MEALDRTIRDYIQQEFLRDRPEVVLTNDLPLIQQGIIDSLGIFLLAGFIEERFGVKIAEDDVLPENFANVNAITDLLMAKLSLRPSV